MEYAIFQRAMKKTEELPKSIQDQLIEVDKITDRLGMPVDEGVRLLVAALRAHGFVTADSCEGHEDRRTNGPRVWLTPGENKALKRKLFELASNSEEARHIQDAMRDNGYRARSALLDLLDDFYHGREVSE